MTRKCLVILAAALVLPCLMPSFLGAQAMDFAIPLGVDKIQPALAAELARSEADLAASDEIVSRQYRILVSLRTAEGPESVRLALRSPAAEARRQVQIRSAQDRVLAARSAGSLTVLNRYQSSYVFSAVADAAAIRDLARLDEVVAVEAMPVFTKMSAQSHPLANVDAVHAAGYTGDGITIAIIDDGIDHDHAAFGGQTAWPNSKFLGGYDFADNDSNPRIDCTGQSHGTAVTGVAAGNGGGITGTAPDAKVVFLKIQSASLCGQPSLDGDVAAAIDWAVTNRTTYGIRVISMSLGGGSYSSATSCNNASTAYLNAVNAAHSAGMIVLAASGNDGLCSQISHPSCMTNVISVGAVYDAAVGSPGYCVSTSACQSEFHATCNASGLNACFDTNAAADQVTCYSNSAAILDILAPSNCATTAQAGGGTNTCFGGTSSATPFAAGVVASLLEADNSQDNDDIRALLTSTGVSIVDSKNSLTKPRIDAEAALDQLSPGGGSVLTNGVPVTGLSGGAGTELRYTMDVPAGASNLVFQTSGGTGDADLYVKFGSAPTTGSFDCRSWNGNNNETCTFATPSVGTYHVLVRGYAAFSGVTLVGSYSTGPTAPCTGCDHYTGTLTGTGDSDVHPNGTYYYSASSGTHEGWLEGPGGTDFDLELYKWNGSAWAKVAQSTSSSSSEHIAYSGTSGYYYWKVLSYSGSGAYDLWLDHP